MSELPVGLNNQEIALVVVLERSRKAWFSKANLELHFAREAMNDSLAQLDALESELAACEDAEERFVLSHRVWKARSLVDVRAMVVEEILRIQAREYDAREVA